MSNVARLKKKAAELEQKKQFEKALQVYIQVLEAIEGKEEEADVALYNRVGDILLRQGDVSKAVDYYERAVDLYSDGGFFNNAIALCNKILRTSPGRSSIYYKLGKISAKKGFKSDAKQNFLEYADRMQKAGRMEEAFRALKEFADLCPDQDDIRLMLAEQLSRNDRKGEALEQLQTLYAKFESEGRTAEARATVDRMKAIDPDVVPVRTERERQEKGSELVFLDVGLDDQPPAPRRPVSGGGRVQPARDITPPQGAMHAGPELLPEVEPAPPARAGWEAEAPEQPSDSGSSMVEDLILTNADLGSAVEGDLPTDFEHTSFGLGEEPPAGGPLLDIEPTTFGGDLGDVQQGSSIGQFDERGPFHAGSHPEPELGMIELPDDGEDIGGSLDLILPDDAFGSGVGLDAGIGSGSLDLGSDPFADEEPPIARADPGEWSFGSTAGMELGSAADLSHDAEQAEPADSLAAAGQPGDLPPEVPDELHERATTERAGGTGSPRPSEAGRPSGRQREAEEDVAPGFEREPAGHTARGEPPVDAVSTAPPQPARTRDGVAEASGMPEMAPRPGRESGVQGIRAAVPEPFAGTGSSTAADPLETLAARVRGAPGDGNLRRQLAEALLEAGERERGLEELESALIGFERAGELESAFSVAEEIIRVTPNSVRHHQKRVEYAFRMSDRPRLVEAYLELADALYRAGQPEKARAVHHRVLELAPDDIRAQAALSAFVEPEPAPKRDRPREPAEAPKRYTATVERPEQQVAAQSDDESYVNLGDWLRDDAGPRSTRMVVQEHAPSGDEQADFAEMLRRFKQGVAENVEEEDHQSHYDLGVAYKEMGLLDEAIAEFQKALRGRENQLRTSEALAQCFLEKSQLQIAWAVLQRALQERGYGDEQLVGVLYLAGYTAEALQQYEQALEYYQRVFMVDIQFRDVAERIAALEQVVQ